MDRNLEDDLEKQFITLCSSDKVLSIIKIVINSGEVNPRCQNDYVVHQACEEGKYNVLECLLETELYDNYDDYIKTTLRTNCYYHFVRSKTICLEILMSYGAKIPYGYKKQLAMMFSYFKEETIRIIMNEYDVNELVDIGLAATVYFKSCEEGIDFTIFDNYKGYIDKEPIIKEIYQSYNNLALDKLIEFLDYEDYEKVVRLRLKYVIYPWNDNTKAIFDRLVDKGFIPSDTLLEDLSNSVNPKSYKWFITNYFN